MRQRHLSAYLEHHSAHAARLSAGVSGPYHAQSVFTRWEAARAQKRGGGQTELLLSELADCLPGGERPEAQLDAQAVTLTIELFLQAQTRENRQLFLRRYYYGDSVRRLSGLFGLTENTVKSRLFRLRAGLRDALLKEGITV